MTTDLFARTPNPVTVTTLSADLQALGVRSGMLLVVHTSLSQLGWVCGGAVAVVQALQAALGPDGTLVMPTHTADNSDPADWQNPPVPESWWPTIRAEMPAFDAALTPSLWMGQVAECFRRQPGTLRSGHPEVSFAARGPLAAQIVGHHALHFGMGEGSPLARIYDHGGAVLLLGVGHANNTSIHLAEYRYQYPLKTTVTRHSALLVDGVRQWVSYTDADTDSSDFGQIGADFAQDTGLERRGPAGYGTAILVPQRQLVDYATDWMRRQRA